MICFLFLLRMLHTTLFFHYDHQFLFHRNHTRSPTQANVCCGKSADYFVAAQLQWDPFSFVFLVNLMTVVFFSFFSIDCIHSGVGVPIPVYGLPEKHYEKSRRSSGQQSIHIRFNNGHCCLLFQVDFRLFTDLRRNQGIYSMRQF